MFTFFFGLIPHLFPRFWSHDSFEIIRWNFPELWFPISPFGVNIVLPDFIFFVFRRKSFSEGKHSIQLSAFFYLFLKLPMTRRVQVCRVSIFYNTSIGCHRGSEFGGGECESRYRLNFSPVCFSLTRASFSTTKVGVLSRDFRVFWYMGFLSRIVTLFRRNRDKLFFFQFSLKNWAEIFIFSEKTEKKSLQVESLLKSLFNFNYYKIKFFFKIFN